MGEEFLRRRIKQRAPRPFAPPRRAHPAGIHQHVERAPGYLDSANGLDLGAADGLVIGNDRQGLGRRARQPPRLLARSAKQMRKVGSCLEVPAAAALDELDAAAFVMGGELPQRDLDVAFPTCSTISSTDSGAAEANRVASTARVNSSIRRP